MLLINKAMFQLIPLLTTRPCLKHTLVFSEINNDRQIRGESATQGEAVGDGRVQVGMGGEWVREGTGGWATR